MTASDDHAERFVLLRPLLFTIAYEILGSTTESDDVLQDSYLRWAQVDIAGVHDTKAYLARLVTRQALNALRAGARRREDYVGPWLPEPLLLDEQDPSADVLLAESVSMAMLVLLETLGPDERAVFVLREVFGFDYDEIASAVGKSDSAVRQIAHRAREHVQARRKRFAPVDPRQNTRIAAEFMAAAAGGDVQAVMSMLAPDVVWTADSDGKASAARRPVIGAEKVARAIVGLIGRAMPVARRPRRNGHLQRRTRRAAVRRPTSWRAFSPSRSSTARSATSMRCAIPTSSRPSRPHAKSAVAEISAKLGACEATGLAISAALMRCCGQSAMPRTGWTYRHRPR